MKNYNSKFSGWVIERVLRFRVALLLFTILLTLVSLWQLKGFSLSFNLAELLPPGHPYVKLYQNYQQFGQANTIFIMLEAREGTIYNPAILEKIAGITGEIDRLPGVNHYQVISLTHKKVKDITLSDWGLEITPLIGEEIPQDSAGLLSLQNKVKKNDFVYGSLVSLDEKSALITGGFLDHQIDYARLYESVEKICRAQEDDSVKIYRAGEPLLLGKIQKLLPQTLWIAGFSLGLILILLLWYLKNWRLAVVPVIAMLLSGLWGAGALSWLKLHLNPLMIVIPILISARVLSHSVQMVSRFKDAYANGLDRREAAREAGTALFKPGLLAVLTDALGITVIILAPVPILQSLGILGTLWILSIFLTVLILNPVLLSYLPAPEARKTFNPQEGNFKVGLERFLEKWLESDRAKVLAGLTLMATLAGIWLSKSLPVGEASAETPLLWPNSHYNLSVKKINENFPGTEQLTVIVQGKSENALQLPAVLEKMEQFQKFMENDPNLGGSVSMADLIRAMNRQLHLDDPKWEKLPDRQRDIAVLNYMFSSVSDPGDLDRFTDYSFQNGSITFYYKNHQARTIAKALYQAENFIAGNSIPEADFKLASGSFGLMAAVNSVIESSNRTILFLTFILIFFSCAWALRSFFAAVLLTLGLLFSQALTSVYMLSQHIGLNLHTLPVLTMGVGVGVDYGIYLLFKLREDFSRSRNFARALSLTLTTAGKPIIFTALVLTVSVIFWYFLAESRFQAEMGLLLGFNLAINLISAIIILPILVWLTRPRFIFGEETRPTTGIILNREEGKHARILE